MSSSGSLKEHLGISVNINSYDLTKVVPTPHRLTKN